MQDEEFLAWVGDWLAARGAPALPEPTPLEAYRVGQLVGAHGVKLAQAAWEHWAGAEFVRGKDFPLGLFAAQWEDALRGARRRAKVGSSATKSPKRGRGERPGKAAPARALPETPAGEAWGRLLEALRADGMVQAAELLGDVLSVKLEGTTLTATVADSFRAALLLSEYSGVVRQHLPQLTVLFEEPSPAAAVGA